ncbi:SOS response-associated peptidase family protein [Cardiobacterium sp. AH-315-I02]|nr:SOS response-associated peptidase family protein [Cardiobacterium sp. AH-315-I02]
MNSDASFRHPFFWRPECSGNHQGIVAVACLWGRWQGEDETLDNCSIIVMPAIETMKSVHERMPAIIAPLVSRKPHKK